MSTITRTLKNLWQVGIKDYFHQMNYIGDTKAGVFIGMDKFGNKYFENKEELPLRTRWVDYVKHDFDAAHMEPGWHAWISYMIDQPPTKDKLLETKLRKWETPNIVTNYTLSRGAYRPYNTTKPKISVWEPIAAVRQ